MTNDITQKKIQSPMTRLVVEFCSYTVLEHDKPPIILVAVTDRQFMLSHLNEHALAQGLRMIRL